MPDVLSSLVPGLPCVVFVLSYVVHGAAWAAVALLLTRYGSSSAAASCSLWRLSLFGPLLTAALSSTVYPALVALSPAGHAAPLAQLAEPFRAVLLIPPARASSDGAALYGSDEVLWQWMTAVWIGSLALGLLRFTRAARGSFGALCDRAPCADLRATERLRRLLERARVAHVRLTESTRISGPLSIGRGEICVPMALLEDMSDAEVDAVLAHELAHLERRDGLWLPLVTFVETLLWLHPLNHIVSARLRHSAELACDDRAVELTGEPRALARALTRAAERAFSRRHRATFLPSLARASSSLLIRVRRLTSEVPSIAREPRRFEWAVMLLIVIGGSLSAFHVDVKARPPGPLGPWLLELQQELRHAQAMRAFVEAQRSEKEKNQSP